MRTVLFCTVGSTHQPILAAIRGVRPDFVCFVCSEDDPATGAKGSWVQIEGEGMVIKASPKDPKPTLPNIPAQLGLAREHYAVLRVPADDFDRIYEAVRREMQARREDAMRILADYTGGTKTMSAALVAAALDEGAELHVISGARPNLDRVADGTEIAMHVSAGLARFQREIARALAPWRRYAYAEAEELLASLQSPSAQEFQALHARARGMSRVFALWDAFAHADAWREAEPLRVLLGRAGYQQLLGTLRTLARDDAKGEALRIADLWRNAERRAEARRFDDAVARWYRMVEWAPQWLLATRAGMETSDVPQEKALEGMQPGTDGRIRAGLMDAWRLAVRWADRHGDVAEFWKMHEGTVRDLVRLRNGSVLAHGFKSLGKQDWERVAKWTVSEFLPWWKEVAGIRDIPEQLPNDGEAFLGRLNP